MRFYLPKKWILFFLMVPMFFVGSAFREYSPVENLVSYAEATSKKAQSAIEIRAGLVEQANKYLGSRYRYSSAGPKAFDCSGFTSFLFSQIGVTLERSSRNQSRMGKRVPISSAQPGDLLFFAVKGNVHHVGLVVKNEDNQLWMIHSATTRGVVLEEVFTSAYWGRRLLLARDVVSELALPSNEEEVSLDSF